MQVINGECPSTLSGYHDFVDLGSEWPYISQDLCRWCGFSKPPESDEIRTYSANQTFYLSLDFNGKTQT